jgi:nitrogen fixation/metabolism regulation signal transduction histidine kinase
MNELNDQQKRLLERMTEENKILNDAIKILDNEYGKLFTIDDIQDVITALKKVKYL